MTSKLPQVPFFRTAFNYDTNEASESSGLTCLDPTLTQQNSKDECDINIIMEKFGRGMALPENFRPPQFGDFLGITDFHSAMNAVAAAGEAFDSMPANLRARFNNDPAQLMEFLDNNENHAEASKLGLLRPPPPPMPENAAPADPGASAPPSPDKQMPKA